MRKKYDYEKDQAFLTQIDSLHNKELHIKITVLTWSDERAIQEIQGRVMSGDLNIDNSSPIRRTGSLTVYVDEKNQDVLNVDNIISINKKVFIELGITNTTSQYTNYDIIWFKLGLFILTDLSIQNNANEGVSFSINIADKMCLLDGSISGKFTATTDIDKYIETDTITGLEIEQKVLIGDLILELVHHLGGESLNNIALSDVSPTVTTAMFLNDSVDNPHYVKYEHLWTDCVDAYSMDESATEDNINALNIYDQYNYYLQYLEENDIDFSLKETEMILDIFFIEKNLFTDYHFTTLIQMFVEADNSIVNSQGLTVNSIVNNTERVLLRLTAETTSSTSGISDEIRELYTPYINILKDLTNSAVYNGYSLTHKYQLLIDKYLTNLYITQYSETTNENTTQQRYKIYDWFDKDNLKTEVDDIEKLVDSPTNYYVVDIHEAAGYRIEDYVYPKDLTANAGDSITSVLDTIVKEMGGNYEYFYDVDGVFHYQEIKNYLNTTYTSSILRNSKYNTEQIYSALTQDLTKQVYKFENSNMIESFQNNLQFSTVKNDFVLWGQKSTPTSDTTPIWYHLAIDDKPVAGDRTYDVIITYEYDEVNNIFSDTPILKAPFIYNETEIEQYWEYNEDTEQWTQQEITVPKVDRPQPNQYYVNENTEPLDFTVTHSTTPSIFPEIWGYNPNPLTAEVDGEIKLVEPHWHEINLYRKQLTRFPNGHPSFYATIKSSDWRNELYLDGLEKSVIDSVPNYYFTELDAHLNRIYNVAEVGFDITGYPDVFEDTYLKGIDMPIKAVAQSLSESYKCGKDMGYKEFYPKALTSSMTASNLTDDQDNKNRNVTYWYNSCNYILSHNTDTSIDADGKVVNKVTFSLDPFVARVARAQYDEYSQPIQPTSISTLLKHFTFDSEGSLVGTTDDLTAEELLFQEYTEYIKKSATDTVSRNFCYKLDNKIEQLNNYFNNKASETFKKIYADAGMLLQKFRSYYSYGAGMDNSSIAVAHKKEWYAKQFRALESLIQIFICESVRQPYAYDEDTYKTEVLNSQIVTKNNVRHFQIDEEYITQRINKGFYDNPSDYPYYLDFISTAANIGKYSVNNIGRRTDSVNNEALNCMIDPDVPNIYLIEDPTTINLDNHPGMTLEEVKENIQEQEEMCDKELHPWAYVSSDVLYSMTVDTYQGLYEATRDLLYVETSMNDKVTLSTIPIYHLDVNSRITIKNTDTSIFGDYLIDSISVPLDVEGMMSIGCTKIVDRV